MPLPTCLNCFENHKMSSEMFNGWVVYSAMPLPLSIHHKSDLGVSTPLSASTLPLG